MSPVSGIRPFSEMFEVVQNELIREAATSQEGKYSGNINQIYLNDLPSLLPERYIKKRAFITTLAQYTTGTVTVGTGTALFNGDSTSWTAANSDDFLMAVDGFEQIYRSTFSAGTLLTSKDSISWTEATGSGLGYTLFQNRYQLATDFAYMVKDVTEDPNAVYLYVNGVKIFLTPWTNEEFDRQFTTTIGSIHAYTVKWSSGLPYLYLNSNPAEDITENIGYEYIPSLTQLREHTTGTATITTGTSLVLTSDARMTTALDTTRTLYFRADNDGTGSSSVWTKISTVTNNSVATLDVAYIGTSSGTGVAYTISEISEWPSRFDDAMIYKTAWVVDPDGKQSEKWTSLFNSAISIDLTVESKRKRGHQLKHFPGLRR